MPLSWLHVVLDVPSSRWTASVRFWSAVTGMAISPSRGERAQFATLLPDEGDAWVSLQSIDRPRPRVHLDLVGVDADVDVDADAVDALVSSRRSRASGATSDWPFDGVSVLRSPGGLLFRHTRAASGGRPHLHRGDSDLVLDQVCIDIPSRWWHAEVRFWQAMTGRDLETGLRPQFAFLGDRSDPVGTPRMLLQRLDADAPAVTAHLDFAVRAKDVQARAHQAYGATVIADFPRWSVLKAPSGHRYCLTDRDPATGSVHQQISGGKIRHP